jgi:protein phosphatase
MQNSVATIQCVNFQCQASNSPEDKFCHRCGIPIVRRYLWAIGDWLKAYHEGEIIGDRYLLKQSQVVLDTQPGLTPQAPEDIPQAIVPYLKLSAYPLHIPQVYGYLPSPDDKINLDIWFLEYGTVPTDSSGDLKYPNFLPEITQLWQEATALRQLNWLWQIAQLWQPLQHQGVVSSLLNPSLLRVNDRIVQLLELQPDDSQTLSLQQLGQLWAQWIPQANPSLTDFLQQLCLHLEQGKVTQPEQLIAILDQGIFQSGRGQTRTYEIFTTTDSGPTRDHNEDACYPVNDETIRLNEQDRPLSIVCDGIGGHEGGEIASQLAIETLLEKVDALSFDSERWNPDANAEALEQAISATNDRISQRNDSENRQERQRIGTTLVMSYAHAQQMYLAHVGDSRIYWISSMSCHQITVDDDLASREVRLGYLLHRDAVQYPNAGALVQALGMSSSASLHPTVQRLILDEDCVFLLCSDGLSDYDRVEQYWESEILPILQGETDIATAGKTLIEIANRQNGHDNVTVALVYCQVRPQGDDERLPLSFSEIESSLPLQSHPTPTEPVEAVATQMPNQPVIIQKSSLPKSRISSLLPLLGIVIGLIGLGGVLSWWLASRFLARENPAAPNFSSPTPSVNSFSPDPEPSLTAGRVIKLQKAIALQSSPGQASTAASDRVNVPQGSLLKIIDKSSDLTGLRLQVCGMPPIVTSDSEAVKPSPSLPFGYQGSIAFKELSASILPNFAPTREELNQCGGSNPAPSLPPSITPVPSSGASPGS